MKIKKIYQIAVAILCVAACVLAACSPAAPGGESTTAGAGSTAAAGRTQGGSAATGAGNTTGSEKPAAGGTRIQLTFGAETVYGTLDDNSVSRDLISRLPLTLTFSDFGGTEKIAYLPEGSAAWDTSDAPDSCTPSAGDITMYAPWGDLAVFYRPFRESDGLVPLGKLDDGGAEKLAAMTGDFSVTLSLADSGAGGTDTAAPAGSKVLVAYFSCTGNTKAVAEKIAALTGGDLYEITPADPYTANDLNYNNSGCRANREMNDPAARPAIGSAAIDISRYDTVVIGYPIWWGTMPRIINTFLDTYDLSGKTVLPFCTSGSSSVSKSASDIRSAEPAANVASGLRVSGANDKNLEGWLRDGGAIK